MIRHPPRSPRTDTLSPVAALFRTLKYDKSTPAPITESQNLMPRRHDDSRRYLWSVVNRTQENLIKGGLSARAANGRRQTTRPVQGIDNGIRLNRALWLLADGLRQLTA